MRDEKFLEQVWHILNISRNEPEKSIHFLTCICEMEAEGLPASYKKIIRCIWPNEWDKAEDKVLFEKGRWELLRKRRRVVNSRLLDSPLWDSFYILLTPGKEFKIVDDPKAIHRHRLEELKQTLPKAKSPAERKKIEAAISALNQKFAPHKVSPGRNHLPAWRKIAVAAGVLFLIAAAAILPQFPFSSPSPQPTWGNPVTAKLQRIKVAVLPFEDEGISPGDTDISSEMTEEVTAALLKFPEMEVTDENAVRRHGDGNLRTMGEALGVRYVIRGNVRTTGDQVFIYVQLSDTQSNQLLWAARKAHPLAENHLLQEDITLELMAALQVAIGEGERARAYARGTRNMDAYAKLIAGYDSFYKGPETDHLLARKLAQEAIALDPAYAAAYALLADTFLGEAERGGSPALAEKAYVEIQRAAALDGSDPAVQLVLSRACWFRGEKTGALQAVEKAVALSPNYFEAVIWQGMLLTWCGDYNTAVEPLEKALRLNPGNPTLPLLFLGYIHEEKGAFAKAAAYFEENLRFMHDQLCGSVHLTVCYAALGRTEAAEKAARKVLAMDPGWTLEKFLARPPMNLVPANVTAFSDHLHQAGLP